MTNQKICKLHQVVKTKIKGYGNYNFYACKTCGQVFTPFLDTGIIRGFKT